MRVYLQLQLWKGEDAALSIEDWAWKASCDDQVLRPVTTDLPPAPQSLLRLVRCNCLSDWSMKCTCRKHKLECSPAFQWADREVQRLCLYKLFQHCWQWRRGGRRLNLWNMRVWSYRSFGNNCAIKTTCTVLGLLNPTFIDREEKGNLPSKTNSDVALEQNELALWNFLTFLELT